MIKKIILLRLVKINSKIVLKKITDFENIATDENVIGLFSK